MTEKDAQDLIDFIIQKSGMYDIGMFVHVGAIDTQNGQKELYELWAALESYNNVRVALSYDCGKTIEIISKLFPKKFEKIAYRRALKKILRISAKGHDIYCKSHDIYYKSIVVLKKNTTLEQLMIEKDLASNDK